MSFEYDVGAVTFSRLCQRTVKHGFERKRVFVALGKQFCSFFGAHRVGTRRSASDFVQFGEAFHWLLLISRVL